MAMKIPTSGFQTLLKDGYKHMQGMEEAVFRNINACQEMTQILRTSYGPNGRNKMIINHLEKLFITNDAATIMKELEVVHPAAKLVALASQQQEAEQGDGTNWVAVFCGELLAKAEELLKMGLPCSDVLQGYELAAKEAKKIMEDLVLETVQDFASKTELLKVIKPAIASKQFGYEDFLSDLVVDAALRIMPRNPKSFNVDNVRVAKVLGGSVFDSALVNGMVFNREPEGQVTKVAKAKVAVFTCPLDISRTETKGTVLIHDAKEMLNFSHGEESSLETVFKQLHDAGVNVIVTSSAVADLALHFMQRHEMMVMKVLSKFDLRRLCRVTGATALARLGVPTAEEMGKCDVVEMVEIGSDRCTVFRQEEEDSKTVSIVIRGGTVNLLDDLERAIDDGVNTVKAVVKDSRLLAGAGAFEIELAKRLFSYGEKTPGLAQYSIKKFAESFEAIPRILAENAGLDATVLVSSLYAAHQSGSLAHGVNVEGDNTDGLIDSVQAGIFDSFVIKTNALTLATHAALTILNIDQIIMSKPAGGPKTKAAPPPTDDD